MTVAVQKTKQKTKQKIDEWEMGEGELQLGKQKNGQECVPIQPP